MTIDIDTPDELRDLPDEELWLIAADDDHDAQMAAKLLLQNDVRDDDTAANDGGASPASSSAECSEGERTFSEVCEAIATNDDISDALQHVAEGLQDSINRGEIDAQ